ncbi:MAG: hypothetical protein EBY09_04655 [Verrucomicrobia bacterium]|nr:hypothetical protein [Verrucomicrobiota bacterium]
MLRPGFLITCAAMLASGFAAVAAPAEFFGRHCIDCHDAETKKGGLDLTALALKVGDSANFATWVKVHDRVANGEMPPKKKARPPAEATCALLGELDAQLTAADTARITKEGRVRMRRMTRVEFENTLADLLALPRLDVQHTSADEMGQIYVPRVNTALMVATVLIVLGFRTSGAIAAAYGIAVTLTMIITVLLLFVVMTERWKVPVPIAMAVMGVFLTIDLAFFGANVLKIVQGGWLPLVVAIVIFTLMTTWRTGRRIVASRLASKAVMISDFFTSIEFLKPVRVPGTAIYMSAQATGVPMALVHNLQYNKVLHERVVLLSIATVQQPQCPPDDRVAVDDLGHGLFNVRLQYGFMEDPDVPRAMIAAARARGMKFDFQDVVYFLGRQTILVTQRQGMAIWREKLFVLMSRNAVRATAYFRLPPERVVELGVQVEL